MHPKIFGIGFHKTGTTSLNVALTQLGFRVTGPNGVDDPNIARTALPMAMRLANEYDAFQDNPWPLLFRQCDERFPGSRFVLTMRPEAAWYRSVLKHFGGRSTPMREWIYGTGNGDPEGREALYLDRFRAHNEAVHAHFAGRESELLVIDLTAGEGWAPLCSFLGLPIPASAFPHANSAAAREKDQHPLRGVLRRVGGLFARR